MTTTLRAALLLAAIVSLRAPLAAQDGAPAIAAAPSGEIRGRLTEASSGAPIGAGSITVRRAADTSFAGGALPDADGTFRVNGLAPGRYVVRFRAIGFAPFVRNDVVISATEPSVNLGTLAITAITVLLETQSVVAERPDVTLAPARNSYAV